MNCWANRCGRCSPPRICAGIENALSTAVSEVNQFRLLRERRFLPFFAAQACGAFNDNLFKNVLVILVTYQAARWSALPAELLANLAAGLARERPAGGLARAGARAVRRRGAGVIIPLSSV